MLTITTALCQSLINDVELFGLPKNADDGNCVNGDHCDNQQKQLFPDGPLGPGRSPRLNANFAGLGKVPDSRGLPVELHQDVSPKKKEPSGPWIDLNGAVNRFQGDAWICLIFQDHGFGGVVPGGAGPHRFWFQVGTGLLHGQPFCLHEGQGLCIFFAVQVPHPMTYFPYTVTTVVSA